MKEKKQRRTFKEWRQNKKKALRWKMQSVAEFCSRHKEAIVVFGPVVIGTGAEIFKVIMKKHNNDVERDLKEKYIYDRSAGHYYELRRKPKQSEWRMIDARRNAGESYGEILYSMGLLK